MIHVVGSTFNKIVMDPTKDVIIEFTSPWCGQCKRLEPKFRDLAKKYRFEKDLVIATMDGVSNESPTNFPVEEFPTIYFASRRSKDRPAKMGTLPIDINCLIKFVKKHATVALHSPLHYSKTSDNKTTSSKQTKHKKKKLEL